MISQEQREIAAVLRDLGMDGSVIAALTNCDPSQGDAADQN